VRRSREKPSSAKEAGEAARRYCLRRLWPLAGSKWVASGQARIKHQRAAAARFAASAAVDARTGNKLLVSAGKLLH